MIVQDWNYWPRGQWGRNEYGPRNIILIKKKLADEIHSLHARLMVSIWPNAMNCPQHADFKQKNLLLHSSAIYDAF